MYMPTTPRTRALSVKLQHIHIRMDVLNRELGRQKIDKEIQDAIDLMRKLRTRRNTLAPISRLPIEILLRIFTTIACSFIDIRGIPQLLWIPSITAVCGHWRAIALKFPTLWCTINCERPIWAEEMLKRSKMAPLDVIASSNLSPNAIDAVRLALGQISRIKQLYLFAPKVVMEKLIDPGKNAPLLQSLCLLNPIHPPRSSPTDELFTLPERLVGDSHHLQRLVLINCSVPWNSPSLCNLVNMRYLSLRTISNAALPTMTQLLGALEGMPLLYLLEILGSLPALSEDSSSSSLETKHVVHLSHLKALRLSSTAVECANLLNHLTYPASTSLGLSCSLGGTLNDLSILFDDISSVWNGKDGSELLHGLAILDTSTSTRLQGWTSGGRTDKGLYPKTAQIVIELKWSGIGPDKAANIVIDVCRALTLTDLCTLSVTVSSPIPKATLLSAFGNSTSLEVLLVHGWPVFDFLSALSSTTLGRNLAEETCRRDNTEEVFLPSLHDLRFATLDFTNFDWDGLHFFEDLRDCLMSRCHWNAEVRELHLGCIWEYYDQVRLLREIVVEVHWQEIEHEADELEEDEDGDL